MTDTNTVPSADIVEEAKAAHALMMGGIQRLLNQNGFAKGLTVESSPAETNVIMDATGGVVVTNDFLFRLGDRSVTITSVEVAALMDGGGQFATLLLSRLERIDAYIALTDAQIIRALLARLGGEVTLTRDEVVASREPSSIQSDGLTLKLLKGN